MSIEQLPPVSAAPADAAEFAAGFQRVEKEIRAVSDRELETINIDVPVAVTTVLGALPEIRALRPQIAALPGADLARIDKLRDYALALGHAHAMYRAANEPSDSVVELASELTELRDVLQADAMALAKRRILDEKQVTKLRGGVGYRNIAFEVVGLVGLLREHWKDIQGRTALQSEDLERAGRRAQELVSAVGLREQAPAAVSAASLLRQRAFTLFLGTYDEARRAVSYLRWGERDVDDITPSLFAGRNRRAADEGAADETVPPTSAAAPVPGGQAVALPSPGVPVGLPGLSPFTRS